MTEKTRQIFADKAKLREKLGIYLQTPLKVEIYAQAAEKMFAKTGGTSIGYANTWSWWGLFGNWGFFLYRKLYLIMAMMLALLLAPELIPALQSFASVISLIVPIVSAMQAKHLVIKDFEKKLDLDNDLALATGVNQWAIYAWIAIMVLYIVYIAFILGLFLQY